MKNKKTKTKIIDLLTIHSFHALGRSAPNPPVAAVIVKKKMGRLHYYSAATAPVGGPHAEVTAIKKFKKTKHQNTKKNARMYVTLEPCNEKGRTGACTIALQKQTSINKIIAFCPDPALKEPSIPEINKIPGKKATYIHKPTAQSKKRDLPTFLDGYLRRIRLNRPRLHLKLAVDANGYMGSRGENKIISSRQGFSFTHILRAQCDAILFGPNTILTDQPDGSLRKSLLRNLGVRPRQISESVTKDFYLHQVMLRQKYLLKMYRRDIETYQPARFFIIGGNADRSMTTEQKQKYTIFFEKQKNLANKYPTRKATYLFLENCTKQWEADKDPSWPEVKFVLPNIQHPTFSEKLLATLAQFACNEVLVEGGHGLHTALKIGLSKGDRVYLLQSNKKLPILGIPMPDFFRTLDFQIQQPLQNDLIKLHVCS